MDTRISTCEADIDTIQGQIPNLVPNTQIGGDALGLVKNGGNVVIGADGTMNSSGGGGWVKLDINNLPTDFKDDEILMMIPKYHVSSSGISTRSFATGCYIHTITNGADMDVPITINPVYGSKTGIAYSTLTNSDDYIDWNNTNTSTRLMTIYAFIDYYETSFTQVGSQNINRANISEYFDSIYRYVE